MLNSSLFEQSPQLSRALAQGGKVIGHIIVPLS